MINYVSPRKNSGGKKILFVCICIAVAVFAAVSAVGLIAGYDGEKRQPINNAISENEQLKKELNEQKIETEKLKKRNEELEEELEKRPSPSPTPFSVEDKSSADKTSQKKSSPREDASLENSEG